MDPAKVFFSGTLIRRVVVVMAAGWLAASAGVAQTDGLDPRILRLVASVSEERLQALVEKLASFETRHTLSDATSETRGIGAARAWIHDEMARSSGRLEVSFDTYHVPKQGDRITRDVELRNVMAILPGRSARRIYVSAHYDTVARVETTNEVDWTHADNVAPGANDDGSGTALTMELARAFGESGIEFDATLVFIALAGEEEGLVGSALHVDRTLAADIAIDAVFNNDIVGNGLGGNGLTDSESVRVFSEGPEDSPSRHLARYMRRQAARYVPGHRVRLIARHDRFGRGGDHTPFNQRGVAAVRVTEANENYRRQHSVADTADGVAAPYLAHNAWVNAAAAASLALAPPAPVVTSDSGRPLLDRGDSGYDARLRWTASAGATGYRVFWREAWTPDWEHELIVGNVAEVTLANLSIDDFIFGVAAVGPDGHESLVSAYVNPPRARVEIDTGR